MSKPLTHITDELHAYFCSVSLREADVLERLRLETERDERAGMRMSPEAGQFLSFLVKLIGAKRTIEIGVFTGYSSLWVALALPWDGKMVACDVSEAWTSVARRYWQEAGVGDKIDLHLAPATETLQKLLDEKQQFSFDFALIDADKSNYDTYYEQCLQLIRPGGLIAIDNVLWHGRVIDQKVQDGGTRAIRALNKKLHADERVDLSLVPIGDGITLLRKR